MVEYTLKKSFRARNISIRVSPPGEVTVTAPFFASNSKIDFFVNKHEEWINKKINHLKQFSEIQFNRDIGKEIIFLGKSYPVKIIQTKARPRLKLDFESAVFHAKTGSPRELKLLLQKFYKEQARKIAENLISKKGFGIIKISMRNQKTRWGSCSRQGSLSLNWRLCMAPLPVFNYVICHEISHMKHFNHSKEFWNEVESLCPGYKDYRLWLRKNGFLLSA